LALACISSRKPSIYPQFEPVSAPTGALRQNIQPFLVSHSVWFSPIIVSTVYPSWKTLYTFVSAKKKVSRMKLVAVSLEL
jgi:hypothetical protein